MAKDMCGIRVAKPTTLTGQPSRCLLPSARDVYCNFYGTLISGIVRLFPTTASVGYCTTRHSSFEFT